MVGPVDPAHVNRPTAPQRRSLDEDSTGVVEFEPGIEGAVIAHRPADEGTDQKLREPAVRDDGDEVVGAAVLRPQLFGH